MSNARLIAELKLAAIAIRMGLPPARPVHTDHAVTLSTPTGSADKRGRAE